MRGKNALGCVQYVLLRDLEICEHFIITVVVNASVVLHFYITLSNVLWPCSTTPIQHCHQPLRESPFLKSMKAAIPCIALKLHHIQWQCPSSRIDKIQFPMADAPVHPILCIGMMPPPLPLSSLFPKQCVLCTSEGVTVDRPLISRQLSTSGGAMPLVSVLSL